MVAVDDTEIFPRIDSQIEEARRILHRLGYDSRPISTKEFSDYMTGDTPTGDSITLCDVLDETRLMVHEVTEISELKKMNVPINKQTVTTSYPKVYEAHITAMELELAYDLDKGDLQSINRVLSHPRLQENLYDPFLAPEFHHLHQKLAPRFNSMIEKFSRALEKQKS